MRHGWQSSRDSAAAIDDQGVLLVYGMPATNLVTLHGREVAYYLGGPDHASIPVVLLHGLGSSGAAWGPVVTELNSLGHRTIAVDLPGHGGSSKERSDYSLGALASVVRDLLDWLGVGQCVLVGHSLGGGIALQFCYQFPERVAGLALVASGGLGSETSRALRWTAMPGAGLVMALAFNNTTLSAAEGLARGWGRVRPLPAILTDSSLSRLREISEPDHRKAFLSTLRAVVDASGQRVSALPRLPGLAERPTLIIWGSADHILPVTHGRQGHGLLDNNLFVIFEGAGHEPHLDDPQRFAGLVDSLAKAAAGHGPWPSGQSSP